MFVLAVGSSSWRFAFR